MTVVLLPDGALVDELGPIPDGVELRSLPLSGPLPDGLDQVDVAVSSVDTRLQDREAIPRMTRLALLQSLHAGVEPLLPLVPPGATLCNASGVHDGPVAEWVVATTLALRRRLPELADSQRAGRWDAGGGGDDLDGARILIVGMGSIGRRAASMFEAFGASVTGVARTARGGVAGVESLPGLIPTADVVVLLVPLTADTAGMVDARFLDSMRDGAALINAARGALVEVEPFLDALRSGRLRAAVDVTDPEPLPDGHPLWSAPGLLITPHVAGSVPRWRARAYRFVGHQLRRFVAGEPLENERTSGY